MLLLLLLLLVTAVFNPGHIMSSCPSLCSVKFKSEDINMAVIHFGTGWSNLYKRFDWWTIGACVVGRWIESFGDPTFDKIVQPVATESAATVIIRLANELFVQTGTNKGTISYCTLDSLFETAILSSDFLTTFGFFGMNLTFFLQMLRMPFFFFYRHLDHRKRMAIFRKIWPQASWRCFMHIFELVWQTWCCKIMGSLNCAILLGLLRLWSFQKNRVISVCVSTFAK